MNWPFEIKFDLTPIIKYFFGSELSQQQNFIIQLINSTILPVTLLIIICIFITYHRITYNKRTVSKLVKNNPELIGNHEIQKILLDIKKPLEIKSNALEKPRPTLKLSGNIYNKDNAPQSAPDQVKNI
jgi:hypothetical protein